MLGSPNDKNKLFLQKIEIEPMPIPFDKIEFKLFGKYIIRSSIAATYLMKKIDVDRNDICHYLWTRVMYNLNSINDYEMFEYLLKDIGILLKEVIFCNIFIV